MRRERRGEQSVMEDDAPVIYGLEFQVGMEDAGGQYLTGA